MPRRQRSPGHERRAPRAPSRAFKRELKRIAREADARLARLRRAAEGTKGRRLVAAELLPLAEALADPALGRHAREALAAACGAAHGLGEAMAECMTCGTVWTHARPPAAVLKISTTKPDATGLGLVCRACVGLDRAGFQAALREAMARDFFGGRPVEPVTAATVAPGGRA